ncbi:MAG: ROK family protein [Cyanothece sp. SIO1E1]|nr:ROK family protein [Cyanothece sp. SIO1E1]
MDVVLGIDIGGTSSKLGLVQADGSIIAKRSVDTRRCRNEDAFFSCLFEEIELFLEQHQNNYHCAGIGIGAPSCDEQAGILEKAANFPFTDKVPILQIFQKHFGLPVYLTKDGNAATLGEARYGAGRYIENFVLVTLGTGIGGGLFLNGQLVKGNNGWAGEFGHIIVEPGGRSCGCGRQGCLETYASATGLRRTVLQRLTQGDEKSILRRLAASELEAKDVYLAAKMGDALSLEVFDDVGRRLGLALANLAATFDPEVFFLAGGLAAAEDILLSPVRKYFEAFVLPQLRGRIRIETSALRLNEAAIAGAASLVWHHKNLITTHDECK